MSKGKRSGESMLYGLEPSKNGVHNLCIKFFRLKVRPGFVPAVAKAVSVGTVRLSFVLAAADAALVGTGRPSIAPNLSLIEVCRESKLSPFSYNIIWIFTFSLDLFLVPLTNVPKFAPINFLNLSIDFYLCSFYSIIFLK